WMIPTFSPDVLAEIVRKLPAGIAVEGREGPDGRRFAGVTTIRLAGSAFYPVVGLAIPPTNSENASWSPPAKNGWMIDFGDPASTDSTARIIKCIHGQSPQGAVDHAKALHACAAQQVGEPRADDLVD